MAGAKAPDAAAAGAAAAATAAPAPPAPDAPVADQRTYLNALCADGKRPDLAKQIEGKTDAQITDIFKKLTADDAAAAAAAAKITYTDFKLPDGVKLDDATLSDLKAGLSEVGLPQDQAQKLIDRLGSRFVHADAVKAQLEAPFNQWRETQTEWAGKIKADPEIGGQNFEGMQSTIAKAIDSLGGKEAAAMREALDFTGAGNNPEICRLFYRAAKAITEGTHVSGRPPAGAQSAASKLYPTANSNLGNQHLGAQ